MRLDEGIEHGLKLVGDPPDVERTISVKVGRSLGDKRKNPHVTREWSCLGARHEGIEQADEFLDENEELSPELLVLQLGYACIDVGLQVGPEGYPDIGEVFDHCVTRLP